MLIRVFKTGPHAHRTPLSYPALAPLWEGQIAEVTTPDAADAYVFAHILDIQSAPLDMIKDWRRRRRPVILLSEEPFWDTIWGRQPMDPVIYVDTAFGTVPVHQLNHATAGIYRFNRIPYYLLTHHRFANAYAYRFARNAAWSVQDWQDRLAAAPVDIGFMFERRPEPHHDVHWPAGDIIGLCAWRTAFAEACQTGTVMRWGRSWQGGLSRFDLKTDWHLDKLMRLDGRCRFLGAVENTHQPDYITEKLFDALACGSVPLYHAGPGHRVHELSLPDEAWINFYGLTSNAAAQRVTALSTTASTARGLREANQRMFQLFGDAALWQDERQRFAADVQAALSAVL